MSAKAWLATATVVASAALAPATAAARTAYVTENFGNLVPIDTATNTTGTPIALGNAPFGVAITPDGGTAYVARLTANQVTPVDTATNTAGAPIAVGANPTYVAITPDGETAYVTNGANGAGGNSVTPIDIATNTPGTAIPVGASPRQVAITPDGKTAYVANSLNGAGGNSVTPIDLATNTPGTAIPVGAFPFGIEITPNGKTAYVANGMSGTVTPIDTATNTAGTPIPVGAGPREIAITPDGKTAYVTGINSNTVTPIDTATNTPGTPITVGTGPLGIAITPDGKTAYAVNFTNAAGGNSVTPIDLATNTAGTAIPVGVQPPSIGIIPDQGPTAVFSAGSAPAGNPVSFDGSASTDPDGTVAGYQWDFGDGSTDTTTSPTTTHAYTTAGSHTATLTAIDNEGCSDTLVFTGQTAMCNASAVGRVSHEVSVTKASPSLAGAASPGTIVGEPLRDTATLVSAVNLGGQVTFRLHGPNDPSCSGNPLFTDTQPVNANGSSESAAFVPTAAGTYRWVAAYSGDANNEPATGACGDAGQSAEVGNKPPRIQILSVARDREHGTAKLTVSVNRDGTVHVKETKRIAGTDPVDVVADSRARLKVRARGRSLRRLRGFGRVKVTPRAILETSDGNKTGARLRFRLTLDD